MAPFDRSHNIRLPLELVISYIVSEIKRAIFIPPSTLHPPCGKSVANIFALFLFSTETDPESWPLRRCK